MNESGRGYAAQWSFTLVSDVYTGGTVWEVESSAEENEVVERPVVKAKSVPSPKVSSVPKAASSSSRDLGALPKGGPVPKAAGPRQQVVRRHLLHRVSSYNQGVAFCQTKWC